MRSEYDIHAKFGHFYNFCLNSACAGVKRVFCKPHVDWKNVAFGVCVVFIFGVSYPLAAEPRTLLQIGINAGHFDHRTKCWLVLWEAGIAFELPPGVFLIYPSSLFLHFAC